MDVVTSAFCIVMVAMINPAPLEAANNGILKAHIPTLDKHWKGDSEYIYKTGSAYTLPCVATGSPIPKYHWYKDGKLLDLTASNLHPSTNASSGSLTINPLMAVDEGVYQCFASNIYGTDISFKRTLKRAVLTAPPPGTPTVYRPLVGDYIKLECHGPNSYPDPAVSWSVVNSQGTTDVTLRMNSRIMMDQNGALHFTYVSLDDAQNGNLYQCNYFNPFLDMSTSAGQYRLDVRSGPEVSSAPSIKYSTPDTVIAEWGGHLKLQCIFSGYPVPNITWNTPFNQQRYANHTNIESGGTVLALYDIPLWFMGSYSCMANNGIAGQASSNSKVFTVDVHSRPYFAAANSTTIENGVPSSTGTSVEHNDRYPGLSSTSSVHATVKEGATVILSYAYEAMTTPTFTWYINGQTVDESYPDPRVTTEGPVMSHHFSNSKIEYKLYNVSLSVTNMTKWYNATTSGSMVIQSTASNSLGSTSSHFFIYVNKKTRITSPPRDVIISEDDVSNNTQTEVNFTCSAETDENTELEFTWRKGIYWIDRMNDSRISVGTLENVSTLKINVRGLSGDEWDKYAGSFICSARNGYTSDEALAQLWVGSYPTHPTWGPPMPPSSAPSMFSMFSTVLLLVVIAGANLYGHL